MKVRRFVFLAMGLLLLGQTPWLFAQEECTVGVAVGKATWDGRPLLWKNRDMSKPNNSLHYFKRTMLSFVGIIRSGDTTNVWMGMNTAGFAIMNASSKDMEGASSRGNGKFMKRALGVCRSILQFRELLEETNQSGRPTRANFGVIDACGNGAIFETGNHSFREFDASDAPQGYLVRSNFAFSGTTDSLAYAYQRQARANLLFFRAAQNHTLSFPYVFRKVSRDLVNESVYPYPLPFEGRQDSLPKGVLITQNSINRYKTVSVAVFHGVLPGENPLLTTMWTILGEPICGIAFPVWPDVEDLPSTVVEGNPPLMNALAQKIKKIIYPNVKKPNWLFTQRLQSSNGKGLLPLIRSVEDSIFAEVQQTQKRWRRYFEPGERQVFEQQIINRVIKTYDRILKKQAKGKKVRNSGEN